MDDELLWEVILSYVGNGSKAAPTAKILGAAARSRAARPYFLTALKRGAAPVALPARLESAARRIGGFLLRRALVFTLCAALRRPPRAAPRSRG